jgi:hypothetical protein
LLNLIRSVANACLAVPKHIPELCMFKENIRSIWAHRPKACRLRVQRTRRRNQAMSMCDTAGHAWIEPFLSLGIGPCYEAIFCARISEKNQRAFAKCLSKNRIFPISWVLHFPLCLEWHDAQMQVSV